MDVAYVTVSDSWWLGLIPPGRKLAAFRRQSAFSKESSGNA
jgi:hypothetical protein